MSLVDDGMHLPCCWHFYTHHSQVRLHSGSHQLLPPPLRWMRTVRRLGTPETLLCRSIMWALTAAECSHSVRKRLALLSSRQHQPYCLFTWSDVNQAQSWFSGDGSASGQHNVRSGAHRDPNLAVLELQFSLALCAKEFLCGTQGYWIPARWYHRVNCQDAAGEQAPSTRIMHAVSGDLNFSRTAYRSTSKTDRNSGHHCA